MKKKTLIVTTILFLIAGAGLLFAFEKSNRESISDMSDSPAVEAELYYADGKPANFSDFRGKIVFVNNWASWCPPCIAEMPTIEQLKNSLPAEDVVFVMVSFDRDPQKGIGWMEQKGLDLPVYFPGKKFPEKFITSSIPTTFILDRNGKVIHTQIGMADYSSAQFKQQMLNWIAKK